MSQRVNCIRSFPNLFIIGIKWSKTAKTYSHSVKTWRTSQLSLSLALNWKFVIPWLSGETSVTSAFRFSHEGCWVIAWLFELIINTDRAKLDSAYGKEVSLSRYNSYPNCQWKQAKWMKDPFFNRSSVIINILTKKSYIGWRGLRHSFEIHLLIKKIKKRAKKQTEFWLRQAHKQHLTFKVSSYK